MPLYLQQVSLDHFTMAITRFDKNHKLTFYNSTVESFYLLDGVGYTNISIKTKVNKTNNL